MRVFISWSKPASHRLALLLKDWLPDVIQQIEPWESSEDIDKGQRWATEVGTQLQELTEGLLCVTADNQREPWLNFEAGALAKSVGQSRVRPVLLGLKPSDLTLPLGQFQSTVVTDRPDMLKLFQSLNKGCASPLTDERLENAFDRVWDQYSSMVRGIEEEAAQEAGRTDTRSADDLMREVLDVVRGLARSIDNHGRGVDEAVWRPITASTAAEPWRFLETTRGRFERGAVVAHKEFGRGQLFDLVPGRAGAPIEVMVFFKDFARQVRLDDLRGVPGPSSVPPPD